MNSIKKNFIYNFIYQILIIILPLITAPYLSRVLTPKGIGIYSYTYSISYYFILFALLGINNYGNRSIARVRNDIEKLSKTFWEIYFMQIITSSIIIIVYFIYAKYISNTKIISLIQGILVISTLFDINWFFFGIEEFKLTITRNGIIKLSTVILIFIFVKNESDLTKYIFIMSLNLLISQIVLWPFLFKKIKFIKPKFIDIKKHFAQNLLLFIPVIAVSLYKIMDKIMLGYISTMNEVGFLENSEKIISIPMGAISALGTIMLPRMSNLIALGKKKESHLMIEKSMLFVTVMGSAFMFGIIGISDVFTPIFFGESFKDCSKIISILAISIIFISWANVIRTQYLIPNNKDKVYIVTVSLGAIINFIINMIFIPIMGAIGAAVGTIIAEISVCIGQVIMVKDEINIKKYIKNGIPFLINGMVMYFILMILKVNLSVSLKNLILQIILGALIYCTLTLIYVKLTKNIIIKEIFESIIKRKKKCK